MIVALTGPTGVGKTDAAWALIELASPMVFLDSDWFAARQPFSWERQADVESVYQALAVMMQFHKGRGTDRFVIPLTVEMALSYEGNRHHFERQELPVSLLRLSCEEKELRERVQRRDRDSAQKSRELEALRIQVPACDRLPKRFLPIDTSGMDDKAVARKVWAIVRGTQ